MEWRTMFGESARFILRATVIGCVLGVMLGAASNSISPMAGLTWGAVLGFVGGLAAMLGTLHMVEAVLWEQSAQRAGEAFYRAAWVE